MFADLAQAQQEAQMGRGGLSRELWESLLKNPIARAAYNPFEIHEHPYGLRRGDTRIGGTYYNERTYPTLEEMAKLEGFANFAIPKVIRDEARPELTESLPEGMARNLIVDTPNSGEDTIEHEFIHKYLDRHGWVAGERMLRSPGSRTPPANRQYVWVDMPGDRAPKPLTGEMFTRLVMGLKGGKDAKNSADWYAKQEYGMSPSEITGQESVLNLIMEVEREAEKAAQRGMGPGLTHY
jgi:hypothetical protein